MRFVEEDITVFSTCCRMRDYIYHFRIELIGFELMSTLAQRCVGDLQCKTTGTGPKERDF